MKCKTLSCHESSESHLFKFCPQLVTASVDERERIVEKHKLCNACFSSRNSTGDCESVYLCKYCGKKHNTMLHKNTDQSLINHNSTIFHSKNDELLIIPVNIIQNKKGREYWPYWTREHRNHLYRRKR
jgi:hypothetical protein